MPVAVAVAPAPSRGHSFANALRGRNRAVSEAVPPPPREPEPAQIPKAASYTHFPRVKDLGQEPSGVQSSDDVTEEGLKAKNSGPGSDSSSSGSTPSSEDPPEEPVEMLPSRPRNTRRPSRFNPFTSRSREPSLEPRPDRKSDRSRDDTDRKAASPARSLAKLRRKSWNVNQPTPASASSPSREHSRSRKEDNGKSNLVASESNKRKTPANTASIPEESQEKGALSEESQSTPFNKKNKRLSGLFTTPANTSAVPAIPTSFSTETLPITPAGQIHASPIAVIPPLPRNPSTEKFQGSKPEPRKKDELWSVFRTLDADLRKFHSKSTSLKANVVRTTLLPSLLKYASHPSNHKLRPEDLDRRVNILNGWWTALLELVAGRNNLSISGTDRPTILEGICAIMERTEWRQPPALSSLADRIETSSTATTVSNASSSSEFLVESVYHNVRNIFTQNLISQMAFVVEKMSMRNAAASLVTFCGKTCAYAFCFCPGIADVLVRLWKPSLDMMTRVLQESGISKMDKIGNVSDQVVAAFPPMLHSLKFSSLTQTIRQLRKPVLPPLAAASFDWYGLWVKRWSGAESDLFYVFVKHYHILVTDFLPIEPSNTERICVPGLVMVHAQILVNLDATINRHIPAQQQEEQVSTVAPVTFDDVLEPDPTTSALAMPPANATRQMAENRLVMLMRDFLSERNAPLHAARRVFAESFARLLQAQARKVSVYDNNACFTLCDFLEEAFIIIVRYEQQNSQQQSVLDWTFWLSVCKLLTVSYNTATEIKLYAFLYSLWPTICVDPRRKSSLCLDFLLEPAFFESRFNHWCPMVRSYFMRLLCWRVARFDGDESVVDMEIQQAFNDRLRSIWAHYLWLSEDAERKQVIPPTTQACNPAPGRRFLIIRNDNPINATNGPFLSFDGVVQSPFQRKSPSASTSNSESEARPLSAMSTDSQDFPDEDVGKGKWNILRNLIGGGSKQNAKTKASLSHQKDKENAGKPVGAKAAGETPANQKPASGEPAAAPASHRSYSFRFSLEWVDKRFGTYQSMRLQPPRLPLAPEDSLQQKEVDSDAVSPVQPIGPAATSSTYAGRSLAEWTFVSHECQNFFDRRKNEGVPTNKQVETPTLNVEAFRRPG